MNFPYLIVIGGISFVSELLLNLVASCILIRLRHYLSRIAAMCLSMGLLFRIIESILSLIGLHGGLPEDRGFYYFVFESLYYVPPIATIFLLCGSVAVLYKLLKQPRLSQSELRQ